MHSTIPRVRRSAAIAEPQDLTGAPLHSAAVQAPPIPSDEEQRLQDLARLDFALTARDPTFDAVTDELARIFGVSAAMISFMDRDTQYYKAAVGLSAPFDETRVEPRELSVCAHVVGTNEMLVVDDLHADERFRDNPLVRESGARFYAGAPLRSQSGRALGAVCIVDDKPRTISDRERDLVRLVARGVMAQVELQMASTKLVARNREVDRDLQQARRAQQFLLPPATIRGDDWAIEHFYQPVDRLGGDMIDVFERKDGSYALLLADVSGHGASAALTTAMTKTAFVRAAPEAPTPAALLDCIHRDLFDATPPGRFMSAVAAHFDAKTKRVTLASAGHPRPLRISRTSGAIIDHPRDVLLLIERDAEYTSNHELTLVPGERLILYTDGAFEVWREDGSMLGVEGLLELAKNAVRLDFDVLATLFGRIQDESHGRLRDDVALLSIACS